MNIKTKPERWPLMLSLVLNMFLLAAIAGGAWRWWSTQAQDEPALHAKTGPGAARGLRFAADGLSPAQRQAFRAAIRNARRDNGDLALQSREGRRELIEQMAAPVFDRAAFDAALARTRAADMEMRKRIEGTVADFGASLSAADRAIFAQGLSTQGNFRQPPALLAAPAAARP